MMRVLLCGLAIAILFFAGPAVGATAGDTETDLWKSESFVKKAQAIKEGIWDKTSARDVAIIGLYEMGRVLDRMERRLQSQTERLSAFVYWGSLVVGVYLILQLILSLTVIVRLGRRPAQRDTRGAEPPGEEFRL